VPPASWHGKAVTARPARFQLSQLIDARRWNGFSLLEHQPTLRSATALAALTQMGGAFFFTRGIRAEMGPTHSTSGGVFIPASLEPSDPSAIRLDSCKWRFVVFSLLNRFLISAALHVLSYCQTDGILGQRVRSGSNLPVPGGGAKVRETAQHSGKPWLFQSRLADCCATLSHSGPCSDSVWRSARWEPVIGSASDPRRSGAQTQILTSRLGGAGCLMARSPCTGERGRLLVDTHLNDDNRAHSATANDQTY